MEHSARSLKLSQVKVYVPSEAPAQSSCGRDLPEPVSPAWVLSERTFSDVINMCFFLKKKKKKAMKEITGENVEVFTYVRKFHVPKKDIVQLKRQMNWKNIYKMPYLRLIYLIKTYYKSINQYKQ